MTKPRRPKPRAKMDPQAKHVRIYRYMFDCPAYRSLNSVARCLLQEVMYRFTGTNNGYIPLSYREALERVGTGSNRAVSSAFQDLQDKGFVRPREKGSFNRKNRHATEWILTNEEYGGREATKDFTRWQPPAKNRIRGALCTPTGRNSHAVVNFETARKVRK